MNPVELRNVTKRYDDTVALADVTISVPRRSIVGLIGRNGSGKTTLLRHVSGLLQPDGGDVVTLGTPASRLDRAELSRMGVVDQDAALIEWMRVEQLLHYVASFYRTWDLKLQRDLLDILELHPEVVVGTLSAGNAQRLALVVATCHRPELLLLDEPLSDLDPIARQRVITLLLDRFGSDETTIVISSHMLSDIEPIINRLICLHKGRVVADDELDALQERHAEWLVTSPEGRLPSSWPEEWVIWSQGDAHRARLVVRDPAPHAELFTAKYGVAIETRPLNLERLFSLLTVEAAPMEQSTRMPRGVATEGR